MTNDKEERKRRDLTVAENYHLWVACGGMCSFDGCRKRLIESTSGELTNVGIKAHIIGHAKNSARHEYMEEYDFTYETLEDVRNLMLMCYDHSKIIDDKKTRDLFPPGLLFTMKEKHENWVSSWSADKKESIALIHKRTGGPLFDIEYESPAPYILLDAVENQTVFDDFTKEGWEEGKKSNEILYQKFIEKIREKGAKVGEIFPLSPIPLLVHLGSLLTDTVSYSIYQFDREAGQWVSDSTKSNKDIDLRVSKEINHKKELAVLVSISGIVKMDSVMEVVTGEFDSIRFDIDNPGLKRLIYRDDVIFVQSRIKDEIEKLLQHQEYNKIHLFYAGPAGLAIELGRGINPNIWSEICLYHYNNRTNPKYQYALSI
ncbi:SAVED domain-containing protein [Cytobacillus oceanisediminis]|uniref:SAVED domain-containing protein n=1 Tax=Cytobacillus oceanisediminis TaxID=665099 RepID=UPI00203C3B56|nr:SAVED domain-containing protein [Cytobacillus oceanisediminis]MCM3393722.1 SAVED domain-containing protein [Cytobacillus oceanisediminis]